MSSWRAAGWIDRVVIEGILIRTHDGRWRLVDTPPRMFRRSGFLTSVCSLSPEQVSVAKVLLGVFGVAVVVILIAVPTAVYLNGESDVGMHYAGAITRDPLTGTGAKNEDRRGIRERIGVYVVLHHKGHVSAFKKPHTLYDNIHIIPSDKEDFPAHYQLQPLLL